MVKVHDRNSVFRHVEPHVTRWLQRYVQLNVTRTLSSECDRTFSMARGDALLTFGPCNI